MKLYAAASITDNISAAARSVRHGLDSQSLKLGKAAFFVSVAVAMISYGSASYSSELDWQQPFNPDSTAMPATISQGGNEYIISDSSPDSFSGHNFTFQKKKASDKSWTTVNNYDPVYKSLSSKSADADLAADKLVFPGFEAEIEISQGTQTTVTIDGQETTIGIDGTSTACSDPNTIDGTIDGTSFSVNQYEMIQDPESDDYLRFYIFQTGTDCDNDITVFVRNLEPDPSLPTGNWQVRVVQEWNDKVSKDLVFNVGSDNSQNIPMFENITVDGVRSFDFNTLSDVGRLSSVRATVSQLESENYNITLVDSNGTAVAETGIDYSDGVVSRLVQFRDIIKSVVFNDDSTQTLKFYNTKYELFDNAGETQGFRLAVEDAADGKTRWTAEHSATVSSSGETSGSAFKIDSVEAYDGSSWRSVSSYDSWMDSWEKFRINLNASVDYPLSSVKVYNEYDLEKKVENISVGSASVSTIEVNGSQSIDDSGTWNVTAEVDSGSRVKSYSTSWSVPWGDLSVEQVAPTSDQTVNLYEEFTWQVNVGCSGGECVNENETLRVWPDPFSLDGVETEVVSE